MRRKLTRYLLIAIQWLRPKPDPTDEIRGLHRLVASLQAKIEEAQPFDWLPQNIERAAEVIEARSMVAAPWLVAEARGAIDEAGATPESIGRRLREADPIGSQGATGDINLMLQTVNWKREINLSWLEFSRWGIQQIILIARLYWMKNPIVRRLVDVCAAYVFARGVEVSTGDEAANAVLKDFFEDNKAVFGRVALMKQERLKDTDGNLFWAFFPDKTDTGKVKVRSLDSLEVMDIICNPEDCDDPWYYLRVWTERKFDAKLGVVNESRMMWYPALDYEPEEKDRPDAIREIPIAWETPVYHRKCGEIGKWLFGCPRIYPMLDWAKEAKRFLEACASIRQALAQFSMTITSKGGQQALDALKQQVMTTVGPTSNLLDNNPPAGAGSTFISGPGTKIEAFKTAGAGFDPEGVRQYKLMCCNVKGVPETFLSDVSTGNLATATTLDRPTETFMLALQEEWVFDLTVAAKFALKVSDRAAGGKLREGLGRRGIDAGVIKIIECERVMTRNGGWRYVPIVEKAGEKKDQRGEIRIQVNFPSIREGDMKTLIEATVMSATLNSSDGEIRGIDPKTMVKQLYRILDVEDGDELAELLYPEATYDPERSVDDEEEEDEPETAPTGAPPAAKDPEAKKAKEALLKAARRVMVADRLLRLEEKRESRTGTGIFL